MSFRVRLTLLTCAALTVLAVGMSFAVYFTDRTEMIGQIDAELTRSRPAVLVDIEPPKHGKRRYPPIMFAGFSLLRTNSKGTFVLVPPDVGSPLKVSVSPYKTSAGAKGSLRTAPTVLSTARVDGIPSRVLTLTLPLRIIRISSSLVGVDRNLSHLRWLLLLISLGGIGAAAVLGAVVSRAAVLPLERLAQATGQIIETGDLTARVGTGGRDEISHLSMRLDELLATVEESQQAQRQLVADASHELRTPIASIRANFDVLATANTLSESERDELLTDIRTELESVTALMAELLELARGDEAQGAPREFRLDEAVKAAVDTAARRTPALTFATLLEPSVVCGWPERVERAVANLLDNARKWSPPGATVDVEVRDGVVEVRDRGPGIQPEDRPFVFDRFYRSTKARGMPGAGLGLSIVKQVAEAHRGTVTVDQAPDGGAIVRFDLSESS